MKSRAAPSSNNNRCAKEHVTIVMTGELSTIIVHHGICVRFNSHNFYFQDANGTSLKVSPFTIFIGKFFHYTNSYACIFYISDFHSRRSCIFFLFLFYRFRTLLPPGRLVSRSSREARLARARARGRRR